MATSGTYGQTTYEVAQLIETAFRRCGRVTSTITQEQLDIAHSCLSLLLQSMINRGVTLWTIQKHVLGLSENQASYELPVGTLDLLNTNLRTIETTTPTWTENAANWTGEFDADTRVLSVSIVPTTTQSLTLAFDYSADGVSWTTLQTVGATTYTAGKIYWFDMEPNASALYFRVRETVLGSMGLDEVTCATTVTERELARINRDDYIALPNKYAQGTPTQFWLDRQITPRIWVWSVPNDVTQSIVLWLQRDLQDVGTYVSTLSVPSRWTESIIWQLAAKICFEVPEIDPNRIPLVLQMASKFEMEVEAEEYDNSPVYLAPNISGYT